MRPSATISTATRSRRCRRGAGALRRSLGAVAALAALAAPAARAWVWPVPPGPRRSHALLRPPAVRPTSSARGAGPAPEEPALPPPAEEPEAGEDCNSSPDGECEIDWDKMGFPEGAAQDMDVDPGRALGVGAMEEELRSLAAQARDPVARRAAEVDAAQARVSLEMAWQLQEQQDECEVERPDTCSDLCVACRGTGALPCRFCRGTKVLALAGMAAAEACPICAARGSEPCGACRGSGWVADWTQLRVQEQPAL